jgi:hypothetical protein
MRIQLQLTAAFMLPVGALSAEEPVTDGKATAWVSAHEKAGGKATLSKSGDGETALSIQKRKGQRPLVSLKGLAPAPGIRVVGLQGYEIADEDLEALAGWKDLREILVVDGVKVTDVGVKAIARLPNLRSVELYDTAVTGKGIATFSGHESLAHLTVSNTIGDGGVEALDIRDAPKLETISLAGEGVTSIVLARLPRLREVSDFPRSLEVANLSGLGRVKDLDFSHTRLKSLSLSDVPLLESLDLRQTRLPEGAIEVFGRTYPGVKIRP